MRIAIIGSGTAATDLPPHFAAEAATLDPAAAPVLVNPRLSAFAFTPYERLVVDLGYVDAVQAAAAQDARAVMINSFADYGIEAARAGMLNEIRSVLFFDGGYINYRHMSILVDVMTFRGALTAVSRHGINRGEQVRVVGNGVCGLGGGAMGLWDWKSIA